MRAVEGVGNAYPVWNMSYFRTNPQRLKRYCRYFIMSQSFRPTHLNFLIMLINSVYTDRG